MSEVGREHRVQTRAVILGGERECPGEIVGFAAEEALPLEDAADRGGRGDTAACELVEMHAVLVRLAQHVQRAVELVGSRPHLGVAVRLDVLEQRGPVQLGGVVLPNCVTVTFFEVAYKIRAERRRPRYAALPEREAQRREAGYDAAEEQRP